MTELPSVGEQFAGYLIQDQVGRGGMSIVYLAEHLSLGRLVALKLLAPELAGDESFRLRFVRESRRAAALEHPNIIPVYEAGDADGVLFIAMRYVRGYDLKKLLAERGALGPRETFQLMRQVAGALDAAHEQGLVHRDVKPANILIAPGAGADGSDHVYLTDFGVAKRLDADSAITRTGEFVGTIKYVAPEQIQGRSLDARADIYSLGCVTFECLVGRVPHDQQDGFAVMWAHVNEPAPAATSLRPDLPAGVDPVLARALAKSPDDRFPTCRQFMGALRGALGAAVEPETGQDNLPTVKRTVVASSDRRPDGDRPTVERGREDAVGTVLRPPGRKIERGTGRQKRSRRRWVIAGAVAAALALVAGLLTVLLPGGGGAEGVNPACTLMADPTGDDSAKGTPQAPLRSVDTLLSRLTRGETGCLRGNFVIPSIPITKNDITLRSATAEMAELDTGTITIAGNGVTIEGLRIVGDPNLIGQGLVLKVQGVRDVSILRNDISNDQSSGGCIYVGEQPGVGAMGTVVAGNLIHNCGPPTITHSSGITIGQGDGTQVINNFIYDNSGYGVLVYDSSAYGTSLSNTLVRFNTIVRNFWGVQIGGEGSVTVADNQVAFNVIWGSTGGYNVGSNFKDASSPGTNNTIASNCLGAPAGKEVYTNPPGSIRPANSNHLDVDPRFVDVQGKDFTVQNPLCSAWGAQVGGVPIEGATLNGAVVKPLVPNSTRSAS